MGDRERTEEAVELAGPRVEAESGWRRGVSEVACAPGGGEDIGVTILGIGSLGGGEIGEVRRACKVGSQQSKVVERMCHTTGYQVFGCGYSRSRGGCRQSDGIFFR